MTEDESFLFTYVAPFVGVLLVAVGIAAAVPGAYALIQGPCGSPAISVEPPDRTQERFGDRPNVSLPRYEFDELSDGEQAAFEEALEDPVNEAHVKGSFPHRQSFRNGTLVEYEGETYYVTIVAENPCFEAARLRFPLGVFATAFGTVAILAPPLYRRLVALERNAG